MSFERFLIIGLILILSGIFIYIITKLLKQNNLLNSYIEKQSTDNSHHNDLLESLIENIPYTVYFKDINSKFTKINSNQASLLGLKTPEEAIGKSDFDFFSHAKEAYEDEQRIIKTGVPLIDKMEQITGADGKKYWVSSSKIPVYANDGEIKGIVGITKDITQTVIDRQQLIEAKRRAEEAEELKSAFIANMSHEIRSPMNAIIGFSDLLLNMDLDKNAKQYLEYIIRSGDSLLNLIDDIINISKIESNQLKISITKTNISELFKELYIFAVNRKKQLEKDYLTINLQDNGTNENLIVKTDGFRIKQVINNFISNALKFTEEGGITINYKVENNTLKFYVKDTGTGIPLSAQKVIFKRFGQVDETISQNRHGTGLGLTICKNIVELMKGKIKLDSEVNKGSTFFVEVPVEIINE